LFLGISLVHRGAEFSLLSTVLGKDGQPTRIAMAPRAAARVNMILVALLIANLLVQLLELL
jgi:hypothetical protein